MLLTASILLQKWRLTVTRTALLQQNPRVNAVRNASGGEASQG